MKLGDTFDIRGYQQVAEMEYANGLGKVVVVHNNSSHFLVGAKDDDSTTQIVQYGYVLRGSFNYTDTALDDYGMGHVAFQYRRALIAAVHLVYERWL